MPEHTEVAVTGNDAVAFFVEVAAIVLLGVWGFHVGSDTVDRLILGIGMPAMATTLWALFAAPKCYYDHAATRALVKVLVLGGAVLAAFVVLPVGWAVAFAVVVALNTALLYVGPFAR
jgi:hypothetical protein